MKILMALSLALCGLALPAQAAETDDLASVISVQQAEIKSLREDLAAAKTALNTLTGNVYTKTEADTRFANQVSLSSVYSKVDADARFYNKTEADNRFMNQSQATSFYTRTQSDSRYIWASQASSFQPKMTSYWAGCSWDEGSRHFTCSCNSGGTAVSVGAGAWGGDSIKDMYYAGNNTWKVTCIDHDKGFPEQMNRCENGAQVLCLRF